MKAKHTRILFLLTTIMLIGFSSVNAHPLTWSDSIEMDEGNKTLPQGERISAPGNVQASDGTYDDYIQVTWDSVVEATYYELYGSDDSDDSYAILLDTGTSTSYDDYAVTGGTYYYYWVRACVGEDSCSSLSIFDAGYIELDPPSSVEATDGTSTYEIEVTWNTSSRATGPAVEVWRSYDDISGNAELLDTVYWTSYSDLTADPGKYYNYWVKACGDDFCSDFSYPDQGYMAVEVPTGVTATDGTYSDRVDINWDLGALSEYEVFRSTSNDPSGSTSLGTEYGPPFSDWTAVPGTVYYYWVKAFSEDDIYSNYSDSDSGFRLALNYHLFLPLILK